MQVKPEEESAEPADHPLATPADTVPKIPAWQFLGATISLIARKLDRPLTMTPNVAN